MTNLPPLETVEKKEKMDAYFAVFNLHCNDAGKRADAAFKKKYGKLSFNLEIAPKHKEGIMSIFSLSMTRRQKAWIRLVQKYVNENRK